MPGPCIIGILSQKGGVGKTSIVVNLSVVLRLRGYRVLTIDGDTSNPSIGLQLGMENASVGFKELVTGKGKLEGTVLVHEATGMHVILGTLRSKQFVLTKADIRRLKGKLQGCDYDFVILDTPPGFYEPDIMRFWNEAILVTTPDTPAVTAVLRLSGILKDMGIERYIVLNKVRGERYELSPEEIEDASDGRVIAAIPDRSIVNESLADKMPAYMMDKNSTFSKALAKLADRLAAKKR